MKILSLAHEDYSRHFGIGLGPRNTFHDTLTYTRPERVDRRITDGHDGNAVLYVEIYAWFDHIVSPFHYGCENPNTLVLVIGIGSVEWNH
jgi:hypothetical protein